MKYCKSFRFLDEQVKIIKDRGILFNTINEEEAKAYLSTINYYKLSGYMKNFETVQDTYNNIEFSEVIDLYNFDRKLARCLFEVIEKIEVSFKTSLAYFIGKHTYTQVINNKKQPNPFDYLILKNWVDTSSKKFNSFGKRLKQELQFKSRMTDYTARNIKGNVTNYFNKYDEEHFLPLWILIDIIDFGFAIQIYEDSNSSIKKEIAKNHNVTNSEHFHFYIRTLKFIRNVLAHHGTIWNYKLIDKIEQQIITRYPDVKTNSIFAVIILIKELAKTTNGNFDFTEINTLLNNFFSNHKEFLNQFGIENQNIELISTVLL